MDLGTYELIKVASGDETEVYMEKESAIFTTIALVGAGIAALVGGGTSVYQGRKQKEYQQQQNTELYKKQDAERLPGQGRADPLPSQYPGQELTGNPYWDTLQQKQQDYLSNRDDYQYGPSNYGPEYYTQRNYLDASWGPARDPSLPIDSGVPYEKANLGYVSPENKGIWAWDPTTPGGLRSTMEMNYAMSQFGPRSGQENFNVGWQEAKEKYIFHIYSFVGNGRLDRGDRKSSFFL
jgi:hypothetical protein